ncbi:MAG: ATP-binding protein [Aulosira sp. DedQUE10]|nr:ATP-binding protein [Aulosira sp. DedQUE10]
MKRDRSGKFIQSWGLEAKQAVNLSLTKTAWQLLKQEADKRGISRSELVERFARSLESNSADNYIAESNGKIAIESNDHNSDRVAHLTLNKNSTNNTDKASEYIYFGHETEEWFRQIIDVIPQIVWTCKPTGELEYFNQQALDVFGVTWKQLIAEGWHPLVHPDDLQQCINSWIATVATGNNYQIECRLKIADGSYRWHLTRAIPNRDRTGQITCWYGTCTDINDSKQLEQVFQQQAQTQVNQNQWLEAVLNLLPIPMLFIDPDKTSFTFSNQAAKEMAGGEIYSDRPSGVYNTDFYCTDATGNLIPGEQLPAFRVARGEKIQGAELNWHTPTGVYPLLVHADTLPAMYDRPATCVMVFQDICGRKRTEQREQFLAQASQTFADARLDLQTLLDTITKLIGDLTGDSCVLSLLSEEKNDLETVSYYHINPEVREFMGKLLAQPHSIDDGMTGRVARTGETIFLPVVSPEEISKSIKREYLPYLERYGVYSLLMVPLKVQEQIIGTLSISRERDGDPYSNEDHRLFQDIADRAAMAITNARLYQQLEQTADRTASLQLVTAALSESLTPAQVAEVIVEQSIAVLNAAAALVAVVCENGTELEIIHSVGFQTEIVNSWRRVSIAIASPLSDTIRTGKPIWEESIEQRVTRYPHLADTYSSYNYGAWISLPLMVEGRSVGGITVCFEEFSALNQDERAFILALSQQAAGAIARAQLYEAEQRARAAAEAANRTKDEFLAILSHELRTPLSPILGWTKLLRNGNLNANKTAIALETIERNAKLQFQLIDDMLDISRILQGKFILNSDAVDLKTTITAAIETVHLAAAAKAIQIHTDFTSHIGEVLGDAARLQQVIWNLLSNAVKFTPAGGRVEIRLETIDSQAQIQVTDTGRGINPEFLPYVFDYFRQADSSITRTFGGLGLGLAIVRQIVELHGGTVKAQSPGAEQGATFTVKLPLLLTPTLKTPVEPSTTDIFSLQGIQVLAVDDEIDNLDLVGFILEDAGATVISVSSAAEVLQLLQQTQPDVLLADIGMPKVDGYTLIRQIREQGGQIPAIALTAYAGETNKKQALQAGFQLYLSKPVDPEELIQAIAQVVQRE